jgi:hypothetical protein
MKKNLILGILDNYTFPQVKKFVSSLRRTRFNGETCLFIGPDTPYRTIKRLKENGIHLEYFNGLNFLPEGNLTLNRFKLRQPINYFNYRHYLYYDYLLKNRDSYENVLLTDVRDVYFQDDPFSFETGNSLYCALEGAGSKIKDCSYNSPWMRYIYGQEALDGIGNNLISCAGTTWGKVDIILGYLEKMLGEIEKVPDAKVAIDQAIHNYMIYTGMLDNVSFLTNDGGVVLTLSYEKNYSIDREGRVRVGDNKLVKVLHQFNRYPDLDALTDKLFMSKTDINFIKFRVFKAELSLHKMVKKLKM